MEKIGAGIIIPFMDEWPHPGNFTVSRSIDNGRFGIQWSLLSDNPDTAVLKKQLEQHGARIVWQESWTRKQMHGLPYFDSLEDCSRAIEDVINPYDMAMKMAGGNPGKKWSSI